MIEQEIKQNAEEYANSVYDKQYQSELWKECYTIHIAGSHSRDEEVKELKEEIESLQEQYKTCFDGFVKRGTKLGELMKENVKLRNPWVSVEDRLPENGEMVFTRSVIKTEGGGKCVEDEQFLVQQFIGKWISDSHYQQKFRGITFNAINNVTHWMPIPQIKKG